MVLMGLQKAFDTVDHDVLYKNLKQWAESLTVSNHTSMKEPKKVKIGDITSESVPITCGMPQGSILGPLLFLCYVNDMEMAVKWNLLIYADGSLLLT